MNKGVPRSANFIKTLPLMFLAACASPEKPKGFELKNKKGEVLESLEHKKNDDGSFRAIYKIRLPDGSYQEFADEATKEAFKAGFRKGSDYGTRSLKEEMLKAEDGFVRRVIGLQTILEAKNTADKSNDNLNQKGQLRFTVRFALNDNFKKQDGSVIIFPTFLDAKKPGFNTMFALVMMKIGESYKNKVNLEPFLSFRNIGNNGFRASLLIRVVESEGVKKVDLLKFPIADFEDKLNPRCDEVHLPFSNLPSSLKGHLSEELADIFSRSQVY